MARERTVPRCCVAAAAVAVTIAMARGPGQTAPAGRDVAADFSRQAEHDRPSTRAAASGGTFLAISRKLVRLGPETAVLPLPDDMRLSPHDEVVVFVDSPGPGVVRVSALDGDEEPIYEKSFRALESTGRQTFSLPASAWQWGSRRVGDWSQVRKLAFQTDWAEAGHVEAGLLTWAEPASDAAQQLLALAFQDADRRFVHEGDLLVATDAVRQFSQEDMCRLMADMQRVDAFLARLFGEAVQSVGSAAPAALIIFRNEREWRSFYGRLGQQWGVEISPPVSGGYAVQDIAAAAHDPMKGTDRPVYLHESAHAIIARRLRLLNGCPEHSWLQEGLANYLQLCLYPSSFSRREYAAQFARPVGPKTFFRPLAELLGEQVQQRHYAQLASLMAFLASQKPQWLPSLAAGAARNVKVEEILAGCGTSLDELEQSWLDWGKQYFASPAGGGAIFDLPKEWQPPASGPK